MVHEIFRERPDASSPDTYTAVYQWRKIKERSLKHVVDSLLPERNMIDDSE